MEQRGTQPTAPSRQVHWYLQLLWKDSPLLYTMPPNTHGAPSLAVHTPILRLTGDPKSQKSPLWWSQGSRSVHSSPSCLAHTRQQPQPSCTRLTPGGHSGGAAGHWHCPLQSWPATFRPERARRSTRAKLPSPILASMLGLLGRGWKKRRGV